MKQSRKSDGIKVGQSRLVKRHARWGYLFIMPWLIGFIWLFMTPFIQSIIFSFNEVMIDPPGSAQNYHLDFVGIKKYVYLFTIDNTFVRTLAESIGKTMLSVVLIVFFSLFASMLINQKFLGRTLVRAIFFLPVVLGSGVLLSLQSYSWLDQILAGSGTGAVGATLGASETLTKYLEDVIGVFNLGLIDVIVKSVSQIKYIIQSSGVQIIIFLAGLQSIPSSLYEASIIEGATSWENFWKITLPMISPILLANVIYTVVDSFTASDNAIMMKIRGTTFAGEVDISLGAAISMVYFVFISILLVVCIGIISRKVFYQNK